MFYCFIISDDDEQPSDRKTSSENAGYKRGQLLLDFSIFYRQSPRPFSHSPAPPLPPREENKERERTQTQREGEATNWNCKSFEESHRARGSVEEHCRMRSLKSPGVTSRFREETPVVVAGNEIAGDIRFVCVSITYPAPKWSKWAEIESLLPPFAIARRELVLHR